jgi:hypothetical protein
MSTILPTTGVVWRRAVNNETGDEVEFFEFSEMNSRKMSVTPGSWVIQGICGEMIGGVANLQRLKDGDFVCRQTYDANDQWVVNRTSFQNLYIDLSAK